MQPHRGQSRKPGGRLRDRPPSSTASAFTLVELLVVVGIIALLVTILMPALTRAIGLARKSVCLANVRRLATAARLYAADNDDRLPPHRLPFNPDRTVHVNKYGRPKPRWPWFLDQGAGPVINPAGPNFTTTRTMTNDHFLCPSVNDKYARDIRNGAYGYNHLYLGCGCPRTDTAPGAYVPWNLPVTVSGLRVPASTVIFGDSRGAIDSPAMAVRQNASTLDPPKIARSLGWTIFWPKKQIDPRVPDKWLHSPAHDRHLGQANVSFVDGHAESMTVIDLGYEVDPAGIVTRDVGDNRLWTGTGYDDPG